MRRIAWFVCCSAALLASPTTFAILPAGTVPETIAAVPAGFGSFSGFFIVDPTSSTAAADQPSTIWNVPTGGGAPTAVGTNAESLRTGVFLPSTFGSFGGDFAAAGFNGNAVAGIDTGNQFGGVFLYSPNGGGLSSPTTFYAAQNFDAVGLMVAPAGFGALAGDMLVNYTAPGVAGIAVLDAAGNRQADLVDNGVFAPFSTAFAPAGFGKLGGQLFFDSDRSGEIDATDANGNQTVFANIALPSNGVQTLKFIGFSPSGFGAFGGDLMVDLAGSSLSADDGMMLFLDASGNIVGELNNVNPRGFTFINGGAEMLLSNTDPSILAVTPGDITAMAEPGSIVYMAVAGVALVMIRKRGGASRRGFRP